MRIGHKKFQNKPYLGSGHNEDINNSSERRQVVYVTLVLNL